MPMSRLAAPCSREFGKISSRMNGDNAASYLALRNVLVVGGSWVAPQQAIAAGDFAGITARARVAAALRR